MGLNGLMDVAVHPRFAETKLVYLTYSKPMDEQPFDRGAGAGTLRWHRFTT